MSIPSALPSRFAFEALNNVVITPHAAGWTGAPETRRIPASLNQVRCLADSRSTTSTPADPLCSLPTILTRVDK